MQAPLWLVERSCTQKRWYRTKGEARAGKQRTERITQKKFRIYACPYCGHFHLATKKDTSDE